MKRLRDSSEPQSMDAVPYLDYDPAAPCYLCGAAPEYHEDGSFLFTGNKHCEIGCLRMVCGAHFEYGYDLCRLCWTRWHLWYEVDEDETHHGTYWPLKPLFLGRQDPACLFSLLPQDIIVHMLDILEI